MALHLARPDGSTALIDIAEIEPGIYQASSTAAQPGIYRFPRARNRSHAARAPCSRANSG